MRNSARNQLGIVAIEYLEPEYAAIRRAIDAINAPAVYVDRKGTGSMAKAYNDGFRRLMAMSAGTTHVWFLSNASFPPGTAAKLFSEMNSTGFAAIHASFDSGHPFTRSLGIKETRRCPFVEFTAPMVLASVFKEFPLDEDMPYWGHDIDWGHRARQAGHNLGIYHGIKLGHTYIQENKKRHPVTAKRAALRRNTDHATRKALLAKYGPDWKKKVWTCPESF